MNVVLIRLAESADYEAAAPIMKADMQMHHEWMPAIYKSNAVPNYDNEKFLSLIADPNSALFVAEKNQEIIGLAAVSVKDIPESAVAYARRVAEIDYISVRHDARRLGIGRQLFEACRKRALEWEADIVLNVMTPNKAALAFYISLGMQPFYSRMLLGTAGAASAA